MAEQEPALGLERANDLVEHLSFVQALKQEVEELHGKSVAGETLAEVYREIHALPEKQAALCLSGGGIRSATFNLGVLQALAKQKMLGHFHYLSTVSGGGYIGSWLSAWMYHHSRGAAGVIEELNPDCRSGELAAAGEPEPKALQHLRQYSNYLSPKLGLLSADTWTLAATFLRNLLLNWLVLIPFLMTVLLAPRLYVRTVGWMAETGDVGLVKGVAWAAAIFGAISQMVAIGYFDRSHPSAQGKLWSNSQKNFLAWCFLPMMLAAVCMTLAWVGLVRAYAIKSETIGSAAGLAIMAGVTIGAGALGMLGGWLVVWLWARRRGVKPWEEGKYLSGGWRTFWIFGALIIASAVGGVLLWVLAVSPLGPPWVAQSKVVVYASFAAPAYVGVFLGTSALLRGLVSRYTSDEDREWTARAGGWLLAGAVGWLAAALLVLYGPSLVLLAGPWVKGALAASGGVAGVATALLAASPRTPTPEEESVSRGGQLRRLGLALAAPLFVVLLIIGLSFLTDWLLTWRPLWWRTAFTLPLELRGAILPIDALTIRGIFWGEGEDWHLQRLVYVRSSVVVTLGVLLLGVSVLMGYCVNVNKFSLHHVYRNRLIRAYLGASHDKRDKGNSYIAFTGFNPDDNLRMHQLWPRMKEKAGSARPRPLHVINMALNLVGGDNLAWQERKAESFTATSLHCGSFNGGYRSSLVYGGGCYGKDRFVPDRAISLGTAMAISGAAASPNSGYHSSPIITLLMTLLNVRLGAWLGNPGKAGGGDPPPCGRSHPKFALRPLLVEAFGLTTNREPYINVSDGGHFENLGLYEMVRRRCHYIVVCDAGCDASLQLEDLGNAIRKIRIDMGVPISFKGFDIQSRSAKKDGKYCAVGTIHYSAVDCGAKDGVLLYIKPSFYGKQEPRDVYNYAARCADFPHETTGDQFYSESQFESYRGLGYFAMMQVIEESGVKVKDLATLIGAAEAYLKKSQGVLTPLSLGEDGNGGPVARPKAVKRK